VIPTVKECYDLMDQYGMLDNVREHSIVVAEVVRAISHGLVTSGVQISVDKAVAGALLIGIGFSGALLSHYIDKSISNLLKSPLRSEIPPDMAAQLSQNLQEFLRPEIVASLSNKALTAIRASIGEGVQAVFWTALLVSFLSIIMCKMMPERKVVR